MGVKSSSTPVIPRFLHSQEGRGKLRIICEVVIFRIRHYQPQPILFILYIHVVSIYCSRRNEGNSVISAAATTTTIPQAISVAVGAPRFSEIMPAVKLPSGIAPNVIMYMPDTLPRIPSGNMLCIVAPVIEKKPIVPMLPIATMGYAKVIDELSESAIIDAQISAMQPIIIKPLCCTSPSDASASVPVKKPAPTDDISKPSVAGPTAYTSAAYTGISPCRNGDTKTAGKKPSSNSPRTTGVSRM